MDMPTELRRQVAAALGWTEENTKAFSVQSLRELVRSVGNIRLVGELSALIESGGYIRGSL
jgi:hypothetical protein